MDSFPLERPTSLLSLENPGTWVPSKSPKQIRVLTLNSGEHQESVLYRLQKGWKLQFRLGPSLLGKRIRLYTNHPFESEDGVVTEFERTHYRAIPWQHESRNKDDDTACFADCPIVACGSYHFYFTDIESAETTPCGSGYFLVDPVLTYGYEDEVLPLDCIHSQTVLCKSLGPLSQWEDRIRVAKETGYNVIHFTPVQELGVSQSSYSIKDQLRLNPNFNDEGTMYSFEDLKVLVQKFRNEWKMLSISDIVLNHTANESPWLLEYPESVYNLINSPHLRPAYLLDRLLHYLTIDISQGLYEDMGICREITTEEEVVAIDKLLKDSLIPTLRLHEFYIVDVEETVKEFHMKLYERLAPCSKNATCQCKNLKLNQDPHYQRLKSKVDWDTAICLYNTPKPGCPDEESRRQSCAEEFRAAVEKLNREKSAEIDDHLTAAVNNVLAAIRYERIKPDGPRIKPVNVQFPLVPQYFYRPENDTPVEDESMMYTGEACFIMAHNGWVMNDDPLRNFAEPGSNVYFRRELVAWVDSVKLRYGQRPEDSPYLWNHMREYAEETARIFHGIRLDNCHSTPLHVAEYILDAARKVRPELYVVAELFTNNDVTDNIFVNRLGISSLIREAMSASNSTELGRLIHRYGGEPVGAFMQPVARPIQTSVAHALFMDQTHDNESPVEKRSIFDLLPSAAIISMAACATGSNRGYDELVPHHINVVNENRFYASWADLLACGESGFDYGIIQAKRALNQLHFDMGIDGFTQLFVDQMTPDVVAVTRHNPATHESVVLVAHTAFRKPNDSTGQGKIPPLKLDGSIQEIVFEAQMTRKDTSDGEGLYEQTEDHVPHPTMINGSRQYSCELRQYLTLEQSKMLKVATIEASDKAGKLVLDFDNFLPGSVVAIRLCLSPVAQVAVDRLRNLISGLTLTMPGLLSPTSSGEQPSIALPTWEEMHETMDSMTLSDMNVALYRCEKEETEDSRPGSYIVPGFGPLIYCGFQGVMSLLSEVRPKNDLGHPLCDNLRQGNWLPEYICNRLIMYEGTSKLGKWLQRVFGQLNDIPRYLVPCYFDAIVSGTYLALVGRTWSLMSRFVNESSTFVKALALGSVQFGGTMSNSSLPELSPSLAAPLPPMIMRNGQKVQNCVTLAAGLPHFSVGYMRNWGRDTFISIRGLFLLTGRYQEARYIILAYAGCLRHGLIPNLLNEGSGARFNCRDAVWWWLQAIKDYCNMVPRGHTILDDAVTRLFPCDDMPPLGPGVQDQPLCEVMQEALQRHFQGVDFRERNAGLEIDREMSDQGFNNQIGVDLETGFIYGGNKSNCGTWMDKMGSSEKAGNKGKPATPRDGCATEIVGLCRSVIGFLWKAYADGIYPYGGVERQNDDDTKTRWTFEEWARRIDNNYEKCYWIGLSSDPHRETKPELVNRRGIYKDSYLASLPWSDYQLRSNYVITMAVAPEMFTPANAWMALQNAIRYLLGPLGMKTLDPSDWAYRGDYNNWDDSCDSSVAHGFNYHQGPEWLWPVGYLLRAMLYFAPLVGGVSELKRTIRSVKSIISRHFVEIQQSPWRSLPELTNHNGKVCPDSNPAQAWSVASILEVLYELDVIEHSQKLSLTA